MTTSFQILTYSPFMIITSAAKTALNNLRINCVSVFQTYSTISKSYFKHDSLLYSVVICWYSVEIHALRGLLAGVVATVQWQAACCNEFWHRKG
jgi:hypothetical protein